VPDEYILAVAEVMLHTPWHTYQVLTKRAARLQSLLAGKLGSAANARNVWWGVSVEDKCYGLPRIEHLRNAPAGLRFLSVEPLLEDLGAINLHGIDWVIVGGESGPGARPMRQEWVEAVQQQCRAANAIFFFKQWGGVQKGKRGRTLHGRTYDDMPPPSVAPIPSREERRRLAHSLAELAAGWTTEPLVSLGGSPTAGLAGEADPSRRN
jgi:protein gp37